MKLNRLFLLSIILVFLLTSCKAGFPFTPEPTGVPAAPTNVSSSQTPTSLPTETLSHTPTNGAQSLDEQMAQIDAVLKQTLDASIAYNKPESMTLDQTVTVELLLNPSLSPQALSAQVTEPGQVASASIQITPRMKALLIADDDTAFVVKPIHDTPEQLISKTDTTRWSWLVTARKGGTQLLTLVIYRLVEYNGQSYWRDVETYKANIHIKVTWMQRVKSVDWGWFVGIFVTAVAIPALWRWIDQRRKKFDQKILPKSRKKK